MFTTDRPNSMKNNRLEQQLARAASLDEPVRRALYFYIGRQAGEVGRDQAARALRISRALAAFHLDKLVEAGLLEASFRRLTGRGGPGAGRPSKLYRRSAESIELSVPERRYELAADLLAQAAGSGSSSAAEGLRGVARERGRRIAAEARARAGSRASSERALAIVMDLLRESGYEPERDRQSGIVLRNCPFDALARAHRNLVCGMNQALIEGVVAGLGVQGLRAVLDPQPGRCCVAIRNEAER